MFICSFQVIETKTEIEKKRKTRKTSQKILLTDEVVRKETACKAPNLVVVGAKGLSKFISTSLSSFKVFDNNHCKGMGVSLPDFDKLYCRRRWCDDSVVRYYCSCRFSSSAQQVNNICAV